MSKKIHFDEPEALSSVGQFHHTFGMPILDVPTIPAEERCKLRIALLEEELRELKEALAAGDIVETADALCDLQYVLSGAILEFGLGHKFKELFDEVQRSNMSKTCKTLQEATDTQKHYQESKGTESYVVEKEGEYLVYRKEDSKVLKSVKYSPADLENILK
jgi:predicted HAD superfamily Cof-like phosphohydrolase